MLALRAPRFRLRQMYSLALDHVMFFMKESSSIYDESHFSGALAVRLTALLTAYDIMGLLRYFIREAIASI